MLVCSVGLNCSKREFLQLISPTAMLPTQLLATRGKTRADNMPRLRARRERPRCRGAEQRDELAAGHSITSSAMASKPGGKVRPSIFAVFKLITNSNFVGWTTGKSAGFSPLRIRPQ